MGTTQITYVRSTTPQGVINLGACGLFINVSNRLNLKQAISPYAQFPGSFQSKAVSDYPLNIEVTLFENSLGLKYTIERTSAWSTTATNTYASFRHTIYISNTVAQRVETTTYYRTDSDIQLVNTFIVVFYDDTTQSYMAGICRVLKSSEIVQLLYPNNFVDVTIYIRGTILNSLDPYGTDENHTPPGGFANFDYTSDDVDIPALPTISAAASGFVRLYNPAIGEVQSLANYLWSGAFDLATYKKLFGNPMDCFLSFGIIPVTPPRSANKEAISFANMPDPGVSAYKLTSQFAEFDCGSVTIDGSKYTSSAMDYSPYTKAELFLPFCGTHSLSVDDIMDSTISIKYHMDLYTGACVAYVKITRTNSDGSTLDSVLYQFTGNILATIPLTGADHSNFIQSMLFMGAAVAATVATAGGAAPEIGGAMAVGDSVSTSALGGAAISASGINAVMSMKPNVIRSGNLSANAGFLGLKKPVITLTCPNLCRPEDEAMLAGMPCQKSGTLSEFSGFNIVGACHLDNIACTMEELRMIDTALAKGVII